MGGWGWDNASSVKVRVQSIMWDRGHIYVSPFFPLTLSTDQRCVLRCVWRVGRSFPKGPSSQRPNKDERSKSNFTRVCGSDYIKKIILKKTLKRVLFLLHQDRLGAVACLQLAVKHFKIQDHVVVIGGYWVFFVVVLFSHKYQYLTWYSYCQILLRCSTETHFSKKTSVSDKSPRSSLTSNSRVRTAV